MKGILPVFVVGLLVVVALVLRSQRKRKKPGALVRIREGIEDALDDAESRTEELRKRARKLRGDAKSRMQERVHEMEARQRELRGRLDELKAEAGKLVERTKP